MSDEITNSPTTLSTDCSSSLQGIENLTSTVDSSFTPQTCLVEEIDQESVEEKEQPPLEEKEQPPVEEKEPPVEETEPPPVEETEPPLEEKEQHSVEEKEQPPVEETEESVEEKEQPVEKESVEEKEPPVEEIAQESVEEKEQPLDKPVQETQFKPVLNMETFIPEYIENVIAQKIANEIIKSNPDVSLSDFNEIPTIKEGITFEVCKKDYILQSIASSASTTQKSTDADETLTPPDTPESAPTLVFIVPYRDRENHLKMFSQSMKTYLAKKQPPYKIFYIHQTDKRSFNRGAMKNIGFLAVKKLYPDDYQNITLVFNDVDTIPTKDLVINYATTRGTIKHFYGFDYALGGIVSINAADFEAMNGFPNFWSWGYEDNMLQTRAKYRGITIDRGVFYKINDPRIIHLTDTPIREVNRTEFDRFLQNTTEGIYSINDLQYTVNMETGFVDVLEFNTTIEENLSNRIDYDLRNGPAPFKNAYIKMPRRAPKMMMNFH
jgi:hypothetical protein